MADHINKKHRSWNMGRIPSKNSKPEVLLRSLLHRIGFRFHINYKKLPGSPDIVLPKYKTVIFVHGCFWHRHNNCSRATTPSTNREYWLKKFQRNLCRDIEVKKDLENQRWSVLIVWECEIIKDPFRVLDYLISKPELQRMNSYSIKADRNKLLKVAEARSRYLIEKG